MIFKQLKMEGFLVFQYFYTEGMKEKAYSDLVQWISEVRGFLHDIFIATVLIEI